MTVNAIDISNYDGVLDPAFLACLHEAGIAHVVVRASLEDQAKKDITRQQIAALVAAGFSVSAYLWCYWDWQPAQTVVDSIALLAGLPVTWLWLDVEDESSVPAPSDVVSWLRTAYSTILSSGFRGGIYTGKWWFDKHCPGVSTLGDIPLWVEQWGSPPDLSPSLFTRFGGWQAPTGKQWAGSGSATLCGRGVDRSVFADVVLPVPAPTPAPEPKPVPVPATPTTDANQLSYLLQSIDKHRTDPNLIESVKGDILALESAIAGGAK